MRLGFCLAGAVGILNRNLTLRTRMGCCSGLRDRGVNLRMDGLAGDSIENPRSLAGRMITQFLGVSLAGSGGVMSDFNGLMDEGFSPHHRNQNRFGRKQYPWLESIELEPVFRLLSDWVQGILCACFPLLRDSSQYYFKNNF